MARILKGQSYTWQLGDRPVGSGDAGEVFSAVCVDAPEIEGVIKKPARVATGGTLQRQAGQIAQEARALLRLDGLPQGKARPPRLLDEAPEHTTGTANYFIVSESARGEALDSMLAQTRQTGKPFPRRVIITVLDALFDLFSRAHRAGVLWNDVKLDHIYWHNATGEVTVIDWGNALFLDQPESGSRPTPPRWEDYHQFLETLGGFLQRSAPDLFADLGWDEFTGAELNLPTISILARRIAYQQEVISLKVMEYQALINVVLSADPHLEGLLAIQEYETILEKIGAPWPRQEVLAYSRALIEMLSSAGEHLSSLRTTSIVFDVYGENLDLPWHLLREVFRYPDLISHPDLAKLVKQILSQDWTEALWNLVRIGAESARPPWWRGLVPVLRQKAVGLVTPPPFEIYQSLQAGQTGNGPAEFPLNREAWRNMGAQPQESPFDYSQMENLAEDRSLPRHLRIQLKESLAAGKEAIRELLQAWMALDWEKMDAKLKQALAWDPDRWALINLAVELKKFRHWLNNLSAGPDEGIPAREYLQTLKDQIPPIHRILGQPTWHQSLMQMLSDLTQAAGRQPPFNEIRHWCPWVLDLPEITQPGELPAVDEAEATQTLSDFINQLRTWSDADAGLQAVRKTTPAHYPACARLADALSESMSLNFNSEVYQSLCSRPPHPALQEACKALAILMDWREALSRSDLPAAETSICDSTYSQWLILRHACETTHRWRVEVTPTLEDLLEGESDKPNHEPGSQEETLSVIGKTMETLKETWSKVDQTGLQLRWLESLEEAADSARTLYLDWRNRIEHSDDRVERLLYHSQLGVTRQVSARLLKLSQQLRLARLLLNTLHETDQIETNKLRTLQQLLIHLEVFEKELIQVASARIIPTWQSILDQIRDTQTSAERRKVVLSLPGDHPLYTWLVDSIF